MLVIMVIYRKLKSVLFLLVDSWDHKAIYCRWVAYVLLMVMILPQGRHDPNWTFYKLLFESDWQESASRRCLANNGLCLWKVWDTGLSVCTMITAAVVWLALTPDALDSSSCHLSSSECLRWWIGRWVYSTRTQVDTRRCPLMENVNRLICTAGCNAVLAEPCIVHTAAFENDLCRGSRFHISLCVFCYGLLGCSLSFPQAETRVSGCCPVGGT